jgi:lipoate-protein ligase A
VRGEYKVPGGKLVRVELQVNDDRLADVRLSGDFFLEPDSALEDIARALVGMPSDATATQLADSVTAALDPRVQMVGFDAQAVGIAVRRAVGAATGWDDHTFDVIAPVVMDPLMHMALDEVLSGEVAQGRRAPLLRFWDWDSSVVIIVSFQ